MSSPIPCERNDELKDQIEKFAEVMKVDAHKLGAHGLSEQDFYESGLFRGAVERLRGQFAASMGEKRAFVAKIFNFLEDGGFIKGWESAESKNRYDYTVRLESGKTAAIELKGCLDGNNTNIFERPPHAHEFVLWSVCTNPSADPVRNAWSGIHTRLSAEIISRSQQVDGVIIWDWLCGSVARPCPKISADKSNLTTVGQFQLPPPCIYLFPATIPSPRNNPSPPAQGIEDVEILKAFHEAFHGESRQLHYVEFEVAHQGSETVRATRISRDGQSVAESKPTAIRRS